MARKSVLYGVLAAAVLVFVAFLTWTAGFLYWHFQITGCLKDLEAGTSQPVQYLGTETYQSPGHPAYQLREMGCRVFPYYVGALSPDRNRGFLNTITLDFVDELYGDLNAAVSEDEAEDRFLRRKEWPIRFADSPQVVQSKCDKIKAWWKQNGSRYHQPWRWWTNDCRSLR
jgi:hypothetical protein